MRVNGSTGQVRQLLTVIVILIVCAPWSAGLPPREDALVPARRAPRADLVLGVVERAFHLHHPERERRPLHRQRKGLGLMRKSWVYACLETPTAGARTRTLSRRLARAGLVPVRPHARRAAAAAAHGAVVGKVVEVEVGGVLEEAVVPAGAVGGKAARLGLDLGRRVACSSSKSIVRTRDAPDDTRHERMN